MKALKVIQKGSFNRTFIVKDKKKIEFWKALANQGHSVNQTIVKEIEVK